MKWPDVPGIKVVMLGVVVGGLVGAGSAHADFVFGTPVLVPNVNTSSVDSNPEISADGLALFFGSHRPGGYGGYADIWVATRATKEDEWSTPVNLGSVVNSSAWDDEPSISTDGLELYFSDGLHGYTVPHRPGGCGGGDLWVSTRAAADDPWGEPINLGATINTSFLDSDPELSADGLTLFFHSERPAGGYGNADLWFTTRPTRDSPWGEPVNLGPTINTFRYDGDPDISPDGRMLFFEYYQHDDSYGSGDLYVTTRPSTSDAWGQPRNLGPIVNGPHGESDPSISPDGSTLYFASDRPGGPGDWDIWQAPIIPIADFNGDGTVDGKDVLVMIAHWGQDEPLCDIGPMPWGDGIVGVDDLKVLAEHIGEELEDPTLVAHWACDETEGDTVYDSAGTNDAFLMGVPLWEPAGGKVGGALQLDGTTFAIAGSVLDPTTGSFSAFAWIKGGAAKQGIISQSGVTWLMANTGDGELATELSGSGGKWLSSSGAITDGNWHRVGVVCNGTTCTLCVDDKEVATGTRSKLTSTSGTLSIGATGKLTPGSFWSGLIDDVRIYNRVVQP